MYLVKLGKTKIFALEGVSGSGKSTVADVIEKRLGAVHVNPMNKYLFKYVEEHYPTSDGRAYFKKNFFQERGQYLDLQKRAVPFINDHIYDDIQALLKQSTPPPAIVVDNAVSSIMYPWSGEPDTEKIFVARPDEARKKSFLVREPGISLNLVDFIREAQMKLMRPLNANLVLLNDYNTVAEFQKVATDVIVDDAWYKKQPILE